MRSLRALVSLLLVLSLVAAACGDDGDGSSDTGDGSTAEDDDSEAGDEGAGESGSTDAPTGDFVGTIDDQPAAIDLDLPLDDPDVAVIEEYRELVGAAPVSYARVTLDNTDGVENTARFLTLGTEFEDPAMDFVCAFVGTFWPFVESTDQAEIDAALAARDAALAAGPCDEVALNVPVPAGEVHSYLVAIEGDIPDTEVIIAGVGNEFEPA